MIQNRARSLTPQQVRELHWFVQAGKASAEQQLTGLPEGSLRDFYQAIIDRADALLPLLEQEEEDGPLDREERRLSDLIE